MAHYTPYFLLLQAWAVAVAAVDKPNILFILTDDQDWHMQSLQHMPLLQKYMAYEGTLYTNHYCTVAICCPSRANMWTGRAAHNLNVTDIFPPYGGYPKVVDEGINDDFLPLWLQEAGYNTFYSGKLWNAHNVDNYDDPFVRGFNGSDFILDPYTYDYLNVHMTRNGAPPVGYPGMYSPDVTAEKAYEFLEQATRHTEPWFLAVAPIAPHSHARLVPEEEYDNDMPKYADRHAHLFREYKIPREANFNPALPAGVSWIKRLPRLNHTVIEYNDEFQRARLRALQSVDEMVEKLIKTLENKELLDNTYIFYTTDNGYHISQYRLNPGKECGFDTDIHIPLLVRGPGVARGHMSRAVTSHTDLAPTIMSLVGRTRDNFDGKPIQITDDAAAVADRTEHVSIEYWGLSIPEGHYGKYGDHGYDGINSRPAYGGNNTYKGLRLLGDGYNLYYSVWCTGEKEYYDLQADPFQMQNLFGDNAPALQSSYSLLGKGFDRVWRRLDALTMVLKSCKREQCTDPWRVLHPEGNVRTLRDALSGQFDSFYEEQPRVSFSECKLGYIREVEGPQLPNVYHDSSLIGTDELRKREPSFNYRGHWSLWT